MSNMNMDDPAKQEQIRRGTHEYIPTAGKHGSYVARQYDRSKNEYPKMMAKFPRPEMKDFRKQNGVDIPGDLALQQYQAAMQDWDRAMTASIVNSKAEEQQWLRENAAAAS
jgi:hypothetical protein